MKTFLVLLVVVVCFACATAGKKEIPGLVGAHYDVEPWALNAWQTNWQSVAGQYLDLLSTLHSVLNNVGGDASVQLTVDVNTGLDGNQCPPTCTLTYGGVTQPLSLHVIDQTDRIALMAYSNSATTMIANCQAEIDYANGRDGKQVVVVASLEVGSPTSQHFATLAAMESALDQVVAAFDASPAFQRTGVFDFGYYKDMAASADLRVSANTPGKQRETYWWCTASGGCDIYKASNRDALLQFALDHAIVTVYIDAPAIVKLADQPGATCTADLATLASFIRLLAQNGIDSELIFGVYNWALTQNHAEAIAYANSTLNFIRVCGDVVVDTTVTSSSSTSSAVQSTTTTASSSSSSSSTLSSTATTTRTTTTKSTTSGSNNGGGCFAAESTVRTQCGASLCDKRIDQLQLGDLVESFDPATMQQLFSPVYYVVHADQPVVVPLLDIAFNGGSLRVTANHLLWAQRRHDTAAALLAAGDLAVGDWLYTRNHSAADYKPVSVLSIASSVGRVLNPLTDNGSIVVNKVAASAYVASASVYHLLTRPLSCLASVWPGLFAPNSWFSNVLNAAVAVSDIVESALIAAQ